MIVTLFFVSFILLARIILSMFVGSVMMSMVESMVDMQRLKWMTLKIVGRRK